MQSTDVDPKHVFCRTVLRRHHALGAERTQNSKVRRRRSDRRWWAMLFCFRFAANSWLLLQPHCICRETLPLADSSPTTRRRAVTKARRGQRRGSIDMADLRQSMINDNADAIVGAGPADSPLSQSPKVCSQARKFRIAGSVWRNHECHNTWSRIQTAQRPCLCATQMGRRGSITKLIGAGNSASWLVHAHS